MIPYLTIEIAAIIIILAIIIISIIGAFVSKNVNLYKEDILNLCHILAILSGTWILGASIFISLSNQNTSIMALSPAILTNSTVLETFFSNQLGNTTLAIILLLCGILYAGLSIILWDISLFYPPKTKKW